MRKCLTNIWIIVRHPQSLEKMQSKMSREIWSQTSQMGVYLENRNYWKGCGEKTILIHYQWECEDVHHYGGSSETQIELSCSTAGYIRRGCVLSTGLQKKGISIWNFRPRSLRKIETACCKAILMGNLNSRLLWKTQTVEVWLIRFQSGIRTLWGTGLEAIHITFWQRICCILSMAS